MKRKITFYLIAFFYAISISSYAADVTVRFKAPTNWEQVFVYTWGPQVTEGWPGNDVTATKDADGFYSLTYDDSQVATGINILFNNTLEGVDALEKTEFYHTGGDACYEPTTTESAGDGTRWKVTAVDCPGAAVGNTTVSFKVPSNWDKVYVYTYSPTLIPDFWGKELLSIDANGFCSFTFDLTTPSINVMFHNGLNEAEGQEKTDIFIEKTGNSCFVPDVLSGINLSVTEVDCPDVDPEGNTTVRFQAPANWDKVYVYTYSPTLIPDFWGKELLNKDADGYYSYSFDLTTPSINVMFHNGLNENEGQEKTDIFIEKTGYNCFVPDVLSGINLSVIEVDCPGTGINDAFDNDITVYPNPTTNYVYVAAPENALNINVYSTIGSLLTTIPAVAGSVNEINLSAYPKGIYYITIRNNDGSKISKTIIKL